MAKYRNENALSPDFQSPHIFIQNYNFSVGNNLKKGMIDGVWVLRGMGYRSYSMLFDTAILHKSLRSIALGEHYIGRPVWGMILSHLPYCLGAVSTSQ